MKNTASFFEKLTDSEINQIRDQAEIKEYKKDDTVFSKDDEGDSFYVVEKGCVSIFIDDSDSKKILNTHSKGGYFGEMGIVNNDKRSASAEVSEESTLLCINKATFLNITNNHPSLAEKINQVLPQRNEELILRETLINTIGSDSKKLYVSIKGDPSLRETALFRERYESPVDKIIDKLKVSLEDLLLNRCVYQLNINFNSGEIHLYTVFDPFREKIYIAETLIEQAYINRHFIEMPYDEKTLMIKSIYGFIAEQPQYKKLPDQWRNIFNKTSKIWEPLQKDEISKVMNKLSELRSVPNFYLRSFSINTIQDAIRLQFNCDGTHIVNSGDYENFLDENFSL
ncbi:MAG: cyclic nucleotide-binding domain-containing protein [Gammaproteobacteria bacterium]|nr:cyclic nucleotide-binding domain-containing protein [Gammaproteobacteria bacterium]